MTPAPGDGLEARVQLRRGDLEVDVSMRVARGEVVALLGPNGAGKTSIIHALAGLIPMVSGRVTSEGEVLADVGAGIDLPPEARPLSVVFQDYRLFPHLTVLENVAYGPRSRAVGAIEASAIAMEMLSRFDLQEVAALRPSAISGGQAQRTALARALVARPRVLLLDEPLGAIDSQARPAARSQLARLLAEFKGEAVLVTHDPVDALTLADRVVVLEGGRVVQEGRTRDIAARPRSPYVAEFVGLNLFRGQASGGTLVVDGHPLAVASDAEAEVFAVLHPRAVALHRDRPAGSPRNCLLLRVDSVETAADRVRISLVGALPLVAEVTPAAVEELALVAGAEVWAEIKATAFTVYPA